MEKIKKTYNIKPKERVKKVFKKVVENGGNVSKSMREEGYSKNTAKNPKKITESKGWKQLMEEYLPDDLLAEVHLEGLQATKLQGVGGMVLDLEKKEMGHTDLQVPDYQTRHKYLDTAYKIKGKMTERPDNSVNVIVLPNTIIDKNDTRTTSSTGQNSEEPKEI